MRGALISLLLMTAFAGIPVAGCSSIVNGSDGLHATVPFLTGMTETQARGKIDEAGYGIGTVTIAEGSGETSPGVVVGQDPAGGTSAPRGSVVNITVSGGK